MKTVEELKSELQKANEKMIEDRIKYALSNGYNQLSLPSSLVTSNTLEKLKEDYKIECIGSSVSISWE
jgi:hypothetical protein